MFDESLILVQQSYIWAIVYKNDDSQFLILNYAHYLGTVIVLIVLLSGLV